MSERRCVAILCHRTVVAAEAAALAEAALRRGDLRPVLVSALDRSALRRLSAELREAIEIVDLDGAPWTDRPGGAVAREPAGAGRRHRLKQALIGFGPARAAILARGVARDRRAARALLATLKPRAVIAFDDRFIRPELVLLDAAREAGIRTLLAPYGSSSPESDALARSGKPEHLLGSRPGRSLKRWAARRAPGHVREIADGPALFFHAFDYPALAAFGLLGGNPWALGGGNADAVCVLGEDDRDAALAEGVAPEKLFVTGQASLDPLFAAGEGRPALRRDLDERFALDPSRPLAVCAVPQSGEHGLLPWEKHRKETARLFEALGASGAAVLLSLHPKSDRARYADLLAAHPELKVSDRPLFAVLAAADLFVATYSSTVRWAVMLGIPSVVVDPARLRYRMFAHLGGITEAGESGWAEAIARLVANGAWRAAEAARARRDAPRVGRLDGRAAERIVALALGERPGPADA